jgi:energy-coupling factor transport system ATP-binding protein
VLFEEVAFSYSRGNGAPSLQDISFEVAEGEFVAVAGLNGSGKSTLCRLINALMLPTRGRVLSCGMDTSSPRNLADIRSNVGLIMQNPDNQIVGPSVEDDVAFGPENLALSRDEIRSRVEEALESMGLSALRDREPHLLSLGERKRLAVAGVLALRPRVLVSDESTSMLDPPTRAETIELFHRLRDEMGITVIHATHQNDEIMEADRVLLLESGRIIFEGPPERLFEEGGIASAQGLRIPVLVMLADELEKLGYPVARGSLDAGEVAAQLWASS